MQTLSDNVPSFVISVGMKLRCFKGPVAPYIGGILKCWEYSIVFVGESMPFLAVS